MQGGLPDACATAQETEEPGTDLQAGGRGSAGQGRQGGHIRKQCSETPRDTARTCSVSVIIWMGQAASVFHRKVTTHSQLRENMGWVF